MVVATISPNGTVETMPGMVALRFQVTGISPLLLHNPAGMQQASAPGIKVKRIPTPEEEAEASTYRLEGGQLYLQSIALRSALIAASKGRKIGKTAAAQVFSAALFTLAEACPLTLPDGTLLAGKAGEPHGYVIDMRRAVVQNNGVTRCRPKLPEWQCQVAFEYDPDFLTPNVIEEAFSLAGRIVGVGDYRPRAPKGGAGGPFGRFRVERVS
jgi:hypothetical protein